MSRAILIFAWLIAGVLVLAHAPVQAQQGPRASLDRDRVTLGETVRLRLEAEGMIRRAPDLSELERNFAVLARAGSSERIQGRGTSVWEFTLEPLAEGVIGIPSIEWAGGRTEPLRVTVLPASPGSAQAGDPIFIEVDVGQEAAYVQQALSYTIRLHYRVTLLEGSLEAPDVEGGVLRQIGEDLTFQREIDGQRYLVVERRFVLIPERSGTLRVGPPRFRGRAQAPGRSFYDGFQAIVEVGRGVEVDIRPRPAQASTPWLPANAVALTMQPPPEEARAGEPISVVLRVRAEGVTLSQLPELELPVGPDYQVYPEAPEMSERFEDSRVIVEGRRRFVIVPLGEDRLDMPASALSWWNVEADRAESAAIPGLSLELAPARPGTVPGVDASPDDARGIAAADPAPGRHAWPWMLLSLGLALGWAVTAVWSMRRGRGLRDPDDEHRQASTRLRQRTGLAMKLRHALEQGDLDAVSSALIQAAPARAPGLDAVRDQLEATEQRAAVDALQRARWAGENPAAARDLLRRAFRHGPRWRDPGGGIQSTPEPLPPLYPRRDS